MWETIITGWTLGLSIGTTCIVTCTPIYIPYLLVEERKQLRNFLVILEISAGRFISYAIFGAVVGFLGTQIPDNIRILFTCIAYILFSIFLIGTVLRVEKHCKKPLMSKLVNITKSPFYLGLLTGISPCPAFLLMLSKALDVGGAISGMLLFIAFFFGTTIYIIPLGFIGFLNKIYIVKKFARYLAVLVAIFFIFSGVRGLITYAIHETGYEIVNFLEVDTLYVIDNNQDNEQKRQLIEDKVKELHTDITIIEIMSNYDKDIIDQIDKFPELSCVIKSNSLADSSTEIDKKVNTILKEKMCKQIIVDFQNTDEHIIRQITFLNEIRFKNKVGQGFEFRLN